jgi:hypothetical protein
MFLIFMSVVMHDSRAQGFRDSSDERYGLHIAGGVASRSKTWKNHSQDKLGVPSQSVLEHKFARLSEAENAYKTKLRELEQQFESKAAALREAYLAAVLEIHEGATSSICYRQ